MRRKRVARVYFWPSLTAVIIILVLVGSSHVRTFLGLPEVAESWRGGTTQQRSPHRWDNAPPPITLQSSGRANEGIDPNRYAPKDRKRSTTSTTASVPVEISAIVPAPINETLVDSVVLAPVRDEQEELAGLGLSVDTVTTTVEPGQSVGPLVVLQGPVQTSLEGGSLDGVSSEAGEKARSPFSLAADRQPRSDKQTDFPRSQEGFLRSQEGFQRSDQGVNLFDPYSGSGSAADSSLGEPIEANSSTAEAVAKPAGVAWPRTPSLDASLVELSRLTGVSPWSQLVRESLWQLQSLPSISSPDAGAALADLSRLAEAGLQIGETSIADRQLQEKVLRTAHALHRRTVVWNAIWKVSASENRDEVIARVVSHRALAGTDVRELLDEVRSAAATTGDAIGWQRYLLLEEIGAVSESTDVDARRLLAQRLLSRVQWEGLSEPQRQWLDNEELHLLLARVRPWAESPIDYVSLLNQLERLEADAIDLGSIEVANTVQNLRFAENPDAIAVAEAINNYYRNANMRMSISAGLIQQLLPEVPSRTTPIRQQIVGVPVRGTGVVDSQLQITLVPTNGAWQFQLQTLGQINSRTGSSQGPVSLTNRSYAEFTAATPIRIDRQGIRLGDTLVDVQSQTRLQNLRTEFDGLPIVSSLVRSIALNQYRERAGLARAQSEQLIRQEIAANVTAEVDKEINKASAELSQRLLGPLGALQLEPLVVDLDTTDQRLAVRYRVAGDWQVAAFTPRPRALTDSVLSVQIHQSTMNNAFEQLIGSGQLEPIDELFARILAQFGVAAEVLPDDLPEDIRVRFAATRPITVEIDDDRLWLTLRIVRLTNGRGLDLTRFVVRAQYEPVVDGMQTRLQRVGHLSIDGPGMGMRERLPVRAIFNKVLNEDRPLPLISPKLADHPLSGKLQVGLLQLTDGWLGLSICPARETMNSERVAAESPAVAPTTK